MFSFSDTLAQSGEKNVSMSGSISESEVQEAKLLLETYIETNAPEFSVIKIDVSGVENVSSIVVAILLSGLRIAKKHSCEVVYVNLPKYLLNIARVGGVEAILLGDI